MAVEFGCLLGQNGGPQSFESVGSWSNLTFGGSLFTQSTDTHSSGFGAFLQVYSGASGALSYTYARPNDAFDRWSTDVTTHRAVVYFWARMDRAAYSGQLTAVFTGSTAIPIPFAATLQPFRMEVPGVTSGTGLRLDFQAQAGIVNSGALYVDDVTLAIDVFNIQPDYQIAQARELNAANHTTIAGLRSAYIWSQRPRFQAVLPSVPSSQADLITRWWNESRNLLFVLDTSDTAARFIVRLGGTGQPFTGFREPYFDQSPGTLLLEGIHGSLDF